MISQEDLKLLADWVNKNGDHQLSFVEKQAIKLVIGKSATVNDLLKTALDLLKK